MINHNPKIRRVKRVRRKLFLVNPGVPRLTVFRSNRHLWVQIIDDLHGKTLYSLSTKNLSKEELTASKVEQARILGEKLAKQALKNNIKIVKFDRGPYLYHGRIKKLAESSRQGGLKF